MTLEERKFLSSRLRRGWPQCQTCQSLIPFDRLLLLPYTNTCVKHSKEGKYIGVPIYNHKTAPEVGKVKTDPEAEDGMGESVRQLLRGYNRDR